MRLIDADKLIKDRWHLVRSGRSNRTLGVMSIADVPTAYDLDKVVEQLAEMYKGFCDDEGSEICCVDYCNSFETCIKCFHERALEIVKGGAE